MSTLLAGKISVDELRSAIRRPAIQNSPRGYTLLELLVVLIIISLVSVMVAPKLVGSLGNLNFKTTAKRLSASLRYTIALFNIDDNRLIVIPDQKELNETSHEILSDEEQIARALLVYELPSDIKVEKVVSTSGEVESGLFSIFFFPNGSSSGGEVTLVNKRGKRLKITVDFITGLVKIE
jgi:general secretion pathway protein H